MITVEPKSNFEIAFNMFDTDGNKKVDKNEFLVVSVSFCPYLLQALVKLLLRLVKRYFCSYSFLSYIYGLLKN